MNELKPIVYGVVFIGIGWALIEFVDVKTAVLALFFFVGWSFGFLENGLKKIWEAITRKDNRIE